jgi:anti-sigma regulatory factor (Ser/Thr protein kinase)
LILSELLSNALRYGTVRIALHWLPQGAVLQVHDCGELFSLKDVKPPEPTAERGRGLMLVQSLARQLTYERDGNGNIAKAVLPVSLRASLF